MSDEVHYLPLIVIISQMALSSDLTHNTRFGRKFKVWYQSEINK